MPTRSTDHAEIVVVEIQAEHGEVNGWGEGLPNGGSQDSTLENLQLIISNKLFPWEFNEISDLWAFIDCLPEDISLNSAICALESAILDSLGKWKKTPAYTYFDHKYFSSKIRYGAPILLGDRVVIEKFCHSLKPFNLRDLRVKLNNDFDRSRETLEIVRFFFPDSDIRIDANQSWDSLDAEKHIDLILDCSVKVVEEPMSKNAEGFGAFAKFLKKKGVMLMACESAPSIKEVREVFLDGFYSLVNVKLCRSGGFRRALRMIDFIRECGLGYQIGCSLGESGILSAAGRSLCLLCGDAKYFDGSYDLFLLEENTTMENISFGLGGEAGPLEGYGLGIQVHSDNLTRFHGGLFPITMFPKV